MRISRITIWGTESDPRYETMRELVFTRYGTDPSYEEVATVYREVFTNFAWPGGYTMLWSDDHGDVLCAACAKRRHVLNGEPVTCDLYDEGPAMQCDDCGRLIEASYGDPEVEA